MKTRIPTNGGLDQAEGEVVMATKPPETRQRKNGKSRNMIKEVTQRVRQGFYETYPSNQPLHAKAFEHWLRIGKKARPTTKVGQVVLKITDPVAVQKAVELGIQECMEILAILQRKAASNQTTIKEKAMVAALGERHGFFLDEDDVLDARRLEVRRHNPSDEIQVYKKLVDFTHAVGTGKNETTAKDLCEGKLPPELQMDGVVEFAKDLGEFLVSSGEEGMRLVAKICEDESFAKNVTAQDHDAPRPIKFLAQISLKVANATRRLKINERKIGFGQ